MAEGGRDDPAIDGQDEVLEWPCKICAEENLIKESVAYCKNCDGCFCKSCLQYHGKFQKAHTVLRIEEKDDWGKPKLAQDTGIECSDHPGQTLSMYCGRHDDVCCPECVSLIHGESCKLSFLPKIAKGVTTGEEFEAAMKTMNSLVIYFTKLGEEYADFKTQLDKSRETCSRSIDDFNTELANLLQNLKESSLTELEEMHDAIDKINRENIEKCCKVKQELQDMQQQMQITPQVNESLLFVYLKNCQKLLPKCSDIATALTAKEQHTIEFQRSQPLLHVIQTVDSFGTCIKSRSVSLQKYHIQKAIREKKILASDQIEEKEQCEICRNTFDNPRVLECGHTFCINCSEQCLKTQQACPTCDHACGVLKGGSASMTALVVPVEVIYHGEKAGQTTSVKSTIEADFETKMKLMYIVKQHALFAKKRQKIQDEMNTEVDFGKDTLILKGLGDKIDTAIDKITAIILEDSDDLALNEIPIPGLNGEELCSCILNSKLGQLGKIYPHFDQEKSLCCCVYEKDFARQAEECINSSVKKMVEERKASIHTSEQIALSIVFIQVFNTDGMEDKFKECHPQVKCEMKDCKTEDLLIVQLSGEENKVKDAQLWIESEYEDKFTVNHFGFKEVKQGPKVGDELSEIVERKCLSLKEKKSILFFNINSETSQITICTTDKKSADLATVSLKKCLKEKEFDTDNISKFEMVKNFKSFAKRLEQKHCTVTVKQTIVHIVGLKEDIRSAENHFNAILKEIQETNTSKGAEYQPISDDSKTSQQPFQSIKTKLEDTTHKMWQYLYGHSVIVAKARAKECWEEVYIEYQVQDKAQQADPEPEFQQHPEAKYKVSLQIPQWQGGQRKEKHRVDDQFQRLLKSMKKRDVYKATVQICPFGNWPQNTLMKQILKPLNRIMNQQQTVPLEILFCCASDGDYQSVCSVCEMTFGKATVDNEVTIEPSDPEPEFQQHPEAKYKVSLQIPQWQGGEGKEKYRVGDQFQRLLKSMKEKDVYKATVQMCSYGKWPQNTLMKQILNSIQMLMNRQQTVPLEILFCCASDGDYQSVCSVCEEVFGKEVVDKEITSEPPDPTGKAIVTKVVTAQMDNYEVDAIVNSSNEGLDLAVGAVSNALSQRAGPELQREVKFLHPGKMDVWEILVSKGHGLKCKHVLHGVLPSAQYDTKRKVQQLEDFTIACIKKAAGLQCKSIAFPALGTGNLGFKPEDVADAMFSAVDYLNTIYRGSSLEEVHFVLFYKDTIVIQAFQKQESLRDPRHVSKECIFGNVSLKVRLGTIERLRTDCVIYLWEKQHMHIVSPTLNAVLKHAGQDVIKKWITQRDSKGKSKDTAFSTAGGNLKIPILVHVPCSDDKSQLAQHFLKGLIMADKEKARRVVVYFDQAHSILMKHSSSLPDALVGAVSEYAPHSKHIRDISLMVEAKNNFTPLCQYFTILSQPSQ